jgi:bZIP transcription factor
LRRFFNFYRRIQNRESATRVRNRKKNYVEELEDEMNLIRAQQSEIQSKFTIVQQENNFLKQQLFFLQKKLGMQPPQQQPQETPFYQHQSQIQPVQQVQQFPQMQNQDFIGYSEETYSVPVQRNIQQVHPQQMQPQRFDNTYNDDSHTKYYEKPEVSVYRTLPRNLKAHTAILGVVTMIICVSFIGKASIITGGNTHVLTIAVDDNQNNKDHTTQDKGKYNPPHDWNMVLGFMMKMANLFTVGFMDLSKPAQYFFGFLYLGYAIYVLVMINWAYVTKVSKKQ